MKKQTTADLTNSLNSLELAPKIACPQALVDCKKIQAKVADTFSSLIQETWLPHGLRSLLVEDLLEAKNELDNGNAEVSNIACRIHSLALTCFAYPELLLKSKTITQIRVLDLEMTPFSTLRQASEEAVFPKEIAS